MIVVHHLENSRSQRVLWLLEELGLEYRIERYERDPVTMLGPDSLAEVHPLGKSPVIVDGDVTVAESGAILEYLVDRAGGDRLIPAAGTDARRAYTYWLHYAEGSLMPLLLIRLIFDRLSQPPVPLLLRPAGKVLAVGVRANFLRPRIEQQLAWVDSQLADTGWFAGDELTAADVQMSFPLEAALERGVVAGRHANIRAFVDRIHALPAYRRALERGGPYDYA